MRINRAAGALGAIVGLACAASAALAPTASADIVKPAGGGAAVPPATHHLARAIVVSGGLTTWQVTVIAIGSALLGAAATILTLRGRARRRPLSLGTP